MPVPLKQDIIEKLPENYQNALKRTMSMDNSALRNSKLREALTDTFSELIRESWIVPEEDSGVVGPVSHLSFFVTKSEKPRVAYDGATMTNGMCINRAVLSGENLLNNLVEVLIRFRLGKYAFVTDISRCFFQVGVPRAQQDLLRIVWFKDNDISKGEVMAYRFTRHVWGLNSSPYIALLAIRRLVEENPTRASQFTLNAAANHRYMDDL